MRALMVNEIAAWPSRTLISMIMPSYNIDPKWMIESIESVRNQIYPHWELCISDDASSIANIRPLLQQYAARDSRIRVAPRTEHGHVSANSNTALALASGNYVALIDANDLLGQDALFWVAREIAIHPEVDLLFSDEDKIDGKGKRFDPYFKPAWNPALMLSQNAFCHLGVYRRSIVEQVGAFREGYEGSQDYDLVLRCSATTTADRIRHIPRVLYHQRALPTSAASATSSKSPAWQAGQLAIVDYLRCARTKAEVGPALGGYYRLEYSIPEPRPLVSIIVPSTLSGATTASCLRSILIKSSYTNFEVLLMARSDHLHRAKSNPEFAEVLAHARVKTVEYEEAPFNFSRVSNLGVRSAQGTLFCFLNDDVETITEDWLERLVARAMSDDVGAVGPMLYYPSNTIQHAGVVLGVGGVAEHAFRGCRRGFSGYFGRAALGQDYSCVTAACLLVKRKIFEQVGGFDETLPVAFNDVDLCIRIRRSGARIVWTPCVEMYHHESLTLGHHASPQRRSQFQRDIKALQERWKDVLANDPCYNPNLSLAPESMFCLAWPPRVPNPMEILTAATRTTISRTSDIAPGAP